MSGSPRRNGRGGRDPEFVIFFLLFWLSCVLSVVTASAAWSAAPAGLEHLMVDDDESLELRDFKAKLLVDNLRALHANISMLEQAAPGSKVFLATFEWRDDVAGRALAHAVIEAERRGVDVTAIIDAADVIGFDRKRIVAAMSREGANIQLFRPFRKDLLNILKRMHEKALWAQLPDGRVLYLIGGRNKSNHYYLGNDVFDVDILITLDAAQGLKLFKQQFEPLLKSGLLYPPEALKGYGADEHTVELHELQESWDMVKFFFATEMHKNPDLPEVKVPWALFVRNRPGKPSVTRAVEAAVAGAKKKVTFANAYIVPHRAFKKLLRKKLADGVEFEGYSNSFQSTKHTNVVRLMEAELSPLMAKGFGLWLRQTGEVHAKATAVDSRILAVGSANFDPRSEFDDTQNALLLDSQKLVAQFEGAIGQHVQEGQYQPAASHFTGIRPLDWCMKLLLQPLKGFF